MRRKAILALAVSLVWAAVALPAYAAADTSTLLYPLPDDRTPDDGDSSNDGGWLLVDFCTAGATGSGPATAPDCHHNDDDSAVSALPFTFQLYEDDFTEVFINNNGNLSFGSLFSTFTATGFPVSGFPMVAPFWGDVDTGNSFSGEPGHIGHVWWKEIGTNTFVVTWDDVGYFNEHGDLRNTFQVTISDGSNADMGLGNNVCFSYADMQWTTGDASGGSGGFGGVPATVGVNRGNGIDFAQIGRFDHAGSDYDGPDGAVDGVDFLDGKNFCLNASGLNIPPIPQGFPPGGMVSVDAGTPFVLDVGFLSPESGQTTTVSIDDVDGAQAAGLNITNTPGNPATVGLSWTPSNADAGTYQLDFNAADDFDPPGETTVTLFIQVISVMTEGEIDIKPGSFPNSINVKSKKGVIPVAILGSDTFDVTTVDVTTLVFAEASPAHDLSDASVYADHLQDVNDDGFTDLVSHYSRPETNIVAGDVEGCVTGELLGGGAFEACDSVRTVPSN